MRLSHSYRHLEVTHSMSVFCASQQTCSVDHVVLHAADHWHSLDIAKYYKLLKLPV